MGDPAEAVFDLAHPKSHPLGLNRPNFTMTRMTDAMRYTPDRMTADGLYEVMGIGRDGTLKIKHEKIGALSTWQEVGPVFLFVYDQVASTYYEAPIDTWIASFDAFGVTKSFPEGKAYYAVSKRDFPCDPVQIEVETNVAA